MIRALFALTSLGLICALVLGFFGFLHPAFDTFSHFRWHFGLGLLALCVVGLVLRVRQVPMILLFFAAIGIWQSNAGNRQLLGEVRAALPLEAITGRYTLLHYNLRFDNPKREAVISMILERDADILSLSETSRHWSDALEGLGERYPYRFHCPEWNTIGGTMVFSKFPLIGDTDYCHAYAALGLTRIDLGGRIIPLGTVHLRWPWPASGPEQIDALKPTLESLPDTALIAGDFNSATWSWSMQRFAEYSGMEIATGFGGTWMYKWLPSALAPRLGLPIDNVLSKGDVILERVESLPAIGSDHLPLWVEFALKKPQG